MLISKLKIYIMQASTFSQFVTLEEMYEKYQEIKTCKELIRCFYEIFYLEQYELSTKKGGFVQILIGTDIHLATYAESIWGIMLNLPTEEGAEEKLVSDISKLSDYLNEILSRKTQAQSLSQ